MVLCWFTGEEIKRQLKVQGIHTRFYSDGKWMCAYQFEASECRKELKSTVWGPAISEEKTSILERLDALKEGDVLVLAGSIPASMPDDMYRNIAARMEGKKILLCSRCNKGFAC